MTGPVSTPEPGAILFLPESTFVGFTEEEAYAFLSGGKLPPLVAPNDVIIAAADVHSGAMIAFVPSSNDIAELLVLDGEPGDQLHITACYLGNAVDIDDDERQHIIDSVAELAQRQPVIEANVFGYNVWNPNDLDPCMVAAVGGDELADAHESVLALLDEGGVDYPEQHEPWVPHITLVYADDPREYLTDEQLQKTGPIVLDRLRVSFGGETHDFPLGGLTAAAAFHLPGKHDQSTHGKGGHVDAEGAAAAKLNGGGTLDPNSPTEAALQGAIDQWTDKGYDDDDMPGDKSRIVGEAKRAMHDPMADTQGALLLRTTAAAPANAPALHRGMHKVHPADLPQVGKELHLGVSSFSMNPDVAEGYARHRRSDGTRGEAVVLRLKSGSRSLDIRKAGHQDFKANEEWLTVGKFKVTGSSTYELPATGFHHKPLKINVFDIEQVD